MSVLHIAEVALTIGVCTVLGILTAWFAWDQATDRWRKARDYRALRRRYPLTVPPRGTPPMSLRVSGCGCTEHYLFSVIERCPHHEEAAQIRHMERQFGGER